MDNESARQPPPRNVLIRLQEIHKAFGSKPILRGVSLDVERGTSVVVMGGSGTGKSVLIKHIVRLLRPDSGIVWVGGRRLDTMVEEDLDELRLGIGYLFQGGALFDSMTVAENLDFILRRHTALGSSGRKESIAEALDWVQLGDKAAQFPAELSGGQRKRAALARSVILGPGILLCDEPTTGLDPAAVRTVSNLIKRLREERGVTAVTITHDLLCAEIIADSACFLHNGHVIANGSLAQLQITPHPALRDFFGT